MKKDSGRERSVEVVPADGRKSESRRRKESNYSRERRHRAKIKSHSRENSAQKRRLRSISREVKKKSVCDENGREKRSESRSSQKAANVSPRRTPNIGSGDDDKTRGAKSVGKKSGLSKYKASEVEQEDDRMKDKMYEPLYVL